MSLGAPPIYNPIADEKSGVVTVPWAIFFNGLFEGVVESWEPTFVSLTENGAATKTGRYIRLNQSLVYWDAQITPGTDVSATAGTTYIDNFPLQLTRDSFCLAMAGGQGSASGHAVASNNRVFIPQLSAVTVPITICGVALAR